MSEVPIANANEPVSTQVGTDATTNDNIADVPVVDVPVTTQVEQPPNSMVRTSIETFTVVQAMERVGTYYKCEFGKLDFILPLHVSDGCIAEFIDLEHKITVAAAKIRFGSTVFVDKQTGKMHIEILLSDLAFVRPNLSFTVKAHYEQK